MFLQPKLMNYDRKGLIDFLKTPCGNKLRSWSTSAGLSKHSSFRATLTGSRRDEGMWVFQLGKDGMRRLRLVFCTCK